MEVKQLTNINATDGQGNNILFCAVNIGDIPLIDSLIKMGADIHHINRDNMSVLLYALKHDKLDIADYLMKLGAVIRAPQYADIMVKIVNYTDDAIIFMIDHFNGMDLTKLLMEMLYYNRMVIAKYLINRGINIDVNRANQRGLLVIASSKGWYEMVMLLHQAGGNINLVFGGDSPLTSAIRHNHELIANYLIDNGADINQLIAFYTPLMLSVRNGCNKIAKRLIELGADIHFINENGFNALYMAVYHDNMEMVVYLTERGAVNYDNWIIRSTYQNPVFDSLLYRTVDTNYYDMTKYLLDHGADVLRSEGIYSGILIVALFSFNPNYINMVKLLVEYGANVHVSYDYENKTMTALHIALSKNLTDTARYLISKNATIRNSTNITDIEKPILKEAYYFDSEKRNNVQDEFIRCCADGHLGNVKDILNEMKKNRRLNKIK